MNKPFALSAQRAIVPERDVQRQIVVMLRAYLPGQIWFSASLAGVRLTAQVAAEAKRQGMERGAMDLSFVFPDGETRYLETKALDGAYTAEQKLLARTLGPGRCRLVYHWRGVREIMGCWMEPYGLTWLTDTQSVRRVGGWRYTP